MSQFLNVTSSRCRKTAKERQETYERFCKPQMFCLWLFFWGGQLLFVDRRLSLCYAFCGIVYILTDKKKSINQRKRKEYAMRNIKKWIVFALILTFLISLPACASSSASLLTAEEVAALEEQVADDWIIKLPSS